MYSWKLWKKFSWNLNILGWNLCCKKFLRVKFLGTNLGKLSKIPLFLSHRNRSYKALKILCLVLLLVPKCFGLVQNFCAMPKIYLHIVAVKNILCQTKRWFAFSKVGSCAGTKVFEEALNAVKFLGWLKKFEPAQNI